MPKTDVKKIESEDLKELSDEALDEARAQMCTPCGVGTVGTVASAPSD